MTCRVLHVTLTKSRRALRRGEALTSALTRKLAFCSTELGAFCMACCTNIDLTFRQLSGASEPANLQQARSCRKPPSTVYKLTVVPLCLTRINFSLRETTRVRDLNKAKSGLATLLLLRSGSM